MVNVKDLLAAYKLLQAFRKNPRIKKKFIRKEISPYNSYSATEDFLERIRKEEILFGPKLWINSGFVVDLVKSGKKSSLELYEKYMEDPQVSYLMALMGAFSLLAFRRGASILKYAVCISPTYPAEKKITEIELYEKGEIEKNKYPNWDDLDWKVFNRMRDPTRSFGKVGGELEMTWMTVRKHFQKIIKDCDIWLSFYPKGEKTYPEAILTFKTKYEANLKSELEKIDRTSFMYKFNETIILYLHYDTYKDLKTFEILKKERKMRELQFSRPIAWENRF